MSIRFIYIYLMSSVVAASIRRKTRNNSEAFRDSSKLLLKVALHEHDMERMEAALHFRKVKNV